MNQNQKQKARKRARARRYAEQNQLHLCTRTLYTGEACPNAVEQDHAGSVPGLCIVHRHADEYQRYSAAGRYQGD